MRIQSEEVVLAALDAGIRVLDTADVYDESEAVVARALAARPAERGAIVVASKGGLVREGPTWRREGRPKELTRACEASVERLGGPIDLYQLHAPDPRVGIEASVRALASLKERGLARALGVSNVTLPELVRACEEAEIAAVQVALGPFSDGAIKDGVVSEALRRDLTVLAYAPFGGPKGVRRISQDEGLRNVALRHGATPFEIALAYLCDLDPRILPVPGPSRVESALSCARAAAIRLTDDDRAELDARFTRLAALRNARAPIEPRPSPLGEVEIVVVMGSPAAGKSTLVAEHVARGFERLNRDLLGGKLDKLAKILDARIAAGQRRFVLDNTYGTRRSRYALLEVAAKHRARVECVLIDCSVEDAQINACQRMLARHERLLEPDEIRDVSKRDPNIFGPNVLFKYARAFEPPDLEEGFTSIERRGFMRSPAPATGKRAVLFDLDGAVWTSRAGARAPVDAEDIDIDAARIQALRKAAEGALVFGIAWQPDRADDGAALADRLRELAGVSIDVRFCRHPAGPPICWCRKPMPGLVLALCRDHGLAPSDIELVGASTMDATFARRLGLTYRSALSPPSLARGEGGEK